MCALTGISVFFASQQIALNEPCCVTCWKSSNWFFQSYVTSRDSSDMPASSGGDAISTGFEPLLGTGRVNGGRFG